MFLLGSLLVLSKQRVTLILVFFQARRTAALANTGIKYRFRVSANYKDIVLLCAVNNYFGTGSVSTIRKGTDVLSIEISSIETIKNIIIPFFDKAAVQHRFL